MPPRPCHSAAQLCVGSACGAQRGALGEAEVAPEPAGSSRLRTGNCTRAPPGSWVEKVEVERMEAEEVSAPHPSVQRATRLPIASLSVLPPSLLLLP